MRACVHVCVNKTFKFVCPWTWLHAGSPHNILCNAFAIPLLLLQMGPFDKQINCIINESYIAFSILVGYRIVLCIIGCVLSLQNRKVKVPELRESRQVGLATYAFLFTVVVEVALVSAVEDTRILAMLLSLEMQVAATFLLLVLFVPKVC